MLNHHAEVIRLRAAGHTYRAIALITGYHYSTVWTIVRQHLVELAPTQDDVDLIRAQLFAEHEAIKDQLLPFVLTDEDAEGNPVPPDLKAVAAHLARSKEQAALYHLHGRHDDVTPYDGDTPIADQVTRETQELMRTLEALGLAGQPILVRPSQVASEAAVFDDAENSRESESHDRNEQ
jgi:hypothetical protein